MHVNFETTAAMQNPSMQSVMASNRQVSVEKEVTQIETITRKVMNLRELISEIRGTSYQNADRLVGPRPEGKEGESPEPPVRIGSISTLDNVVNAAIREARVALGEASRLNNL